MVSPPVPVAIVLPVHCISPFPLFLFHWLFLCRLPTLHCLATSLLLCFVTVTQQCCGCWYGAICQAPAYAPHMEYLLDGGGGTCWTKRSKSASNPMFRWSWQMQEVEVPHNNIDYTAYQNFCPGKQNKIKLFLVTSHTSQTLVTSLEQKTLLTVKGQIKMTECLEKRRKSASARKTSISVRIHPSIHHRFLTNTLLKVRISVVWPGQSKN